MSRRQRDESRAAGEEWRVTDPAGRRRKERPGGNRKCQGPGAQGQEGAEKEMGHEVAGIRTNKRGLA